MFVVQVLLSFIYKKKKEKYLVIFNILYICKILLISNHLYHFHLLEICI